MKVHEKIREIRDKKRWSQEEMATRLNMSAGGYAKIERGETRLNLPRLEQIAEILEVDIFDLIHRQDGCTVYQVIEGDNNNHISYGNQDEKQHQEIKQLNLIIQHKDELLQHKDGLLQQQQRELQTQQEMIQLLKQQLTILNAK